MNKTRLLNEQDITYLKGIFGDIVATKNEGMCMNDQGHVYIPSTLMSEEPYDIISSFYSPVAKRIHLTYANNKPKEFAMGGSQAHKLPPWIAYDYVEGVWIDLTERGIEQNAILCSYFMLPYTFHLYVGKKGRKGIFFREKVFDEKGNVTYKIRKGDNVEYIQSLHFLTLQGQYPKDFFKFSKRGTHLYYFKTKLDLAPYVGDKSMGGRSQDGICIRFDNRKGAKMLDVDVSSYAEYKYLSFEKIGDVLQEKGFIWT